MKPMVGIDVAKKTVVAAVVDVDYRVLVSPTNLQNNDEVLQDWLRARRISYPGLAVTCESTSYYHYPVVRACVAVGIACRVLNPIVTKQVTKATIRGKKTGASDAILIAQLGLRGEGILTTGATNNAKVLLRANDKFQVVAQSLRLFSQSLVERHVLLPPGSDRHYQTCLEALEALVAGCRVAVISATPKPILGLLTSIPGVGQKTAAVLVAEIGDIARFSSAEKLVAYTGFDPRVRQSGTSLHRNTCLTKRGSPSLRRAVYAAANVTRQYDTQVKAYYQKKRSQGRTHTEAMIPTCRRLLNRIYAVWKTGKQYEKRA